MRVKRRDTKETFMKKKVNRSELDDDMLPEYDFSKMKISRARYLC